MDINIILEADVSPQQFAELAVEAERLGVRGIWSSNYHMFYDAFMVLAPAAAATSKILMGPLAVSPYEMHPLKIANALLTLNELSNGRAKVAIGGGGGVFGAISWRTNEGGAEWPPMDPVKKTSAPPRRVRSVIDTIEIIDKARSGEFQRGYEGGVFSVRRPFGMMWAKAPKPLVYSCSTGPMMCRMAGRVADGLQISDGTPEMIEHLSGEIQKGIAKRTTPINDFRVGNFWAWHIKDDLEASMFEARRELIWRAAIIGQTREEIRPYCHDDDEVELVINNWENLRIAFRNRSGVIEGIPEDLVNRLIAGMASAGDKSAIDREVERYQQMAKAGLTELDLRLFDDPMAGLKMIGKHIIPAVR